MFFSSGLRLWSLTKFTKKISNFTGELFLHVQHDIKYMENFLTFLSCWNFSLKIIPFVTSMLLNYAMKVFKLKEKSYYFKTVIMNIIFHYITDNFWFFIGKQLGNFQNTFPIIILFYIIQLLWHIFVLFHNLDFKNTLFSLSCWSLNYFSNLEPVLWKVPLKN